MPAKSQKQRAYLHAKFGADWCARHHFNNKGKLPAKAAKTEGMQAAAVVDQLLEYHLDQRSCPNCDSPLKPHAESLKCHKCGYMKNIRLEGRDDTAKLPLGKAGHAYAGITSKDVMSQPGGTAKKWSKNVALRKEVTGQQHVSNSKGAKVFPSMDKSGPVNTKEIKETRSARQLFKRV